MTNPASEADAAATSSLTPAVASPSTAGAAAPATATPAADSSGHKQVGKAALIYGLGMVLSRLASLIMLPVYTRMLKPDDYGLLQMLDITVDIVALLVNAGTLAGVMRFYFKAESDLEKRAVLASAVLLQTGLDLVGTGLMAAAAIPIWQHVLHGAGSPGLVYLAAANFTLMSLSAVPMLYMQMQQKALLFTSLSLAKLLMQLSLNIVFLVVMRMGPGGILLSSFITNLVLGTASLVWLLRRNGMHFTRSAIRDLRRFGVPYQLVTAGTFLLTFGDRFFLDKYWGLAAVGLYSLAYQFGFMLDQLGSAPYLRAWMPSCFAHVKDPREVRDRLYNRGLLQHNLLLISAAVGMSLFVHPVLRVMSDAAYHSAANIVPLIAAAVVMQILGVVVRFGIDASEQTKYVTYGTWISVAVIVVLYATLIPMFGAVGAALATFAAYAVRFGVFYRFAQRLHPISYEWGPTLRLVLIGAAPVVTMLSFRPAHLGLEIVAAAACFLAYAATAWRLVLHEDDRRDIAGFVGARLGRVTARFARA